MSTRKRPSASTPETSGEDGAEVVLAPASSTRTSTRVVPAGARPVRTKGTSKGSRRPKTPEATSSGTSSKSPVPARVAGPGGASRRKTMAERVVILKRRMIAPALTAATARA